LILREGWLLTKLVLIAMQEQKRSAASEVSTEDWSVLIPGNVETFVGYDQSDEM
jgi:alanyl-tRNA synthetase